jgi:hypothetical protein
VYDSRRSGLGIACSDQVLKLMESLRNPAVRGAQGMSAATIGQARNRLRILHKVLMAKEHLESYGVAAMIDALLGNAATAEDDTDHSGEAPARQGMVWTASDGDALGWQSARRRMCRRSCGSC